MAETDKFKCMEPEPLFYVWRRSSHNLAGAGVGSRTSPKPPKKVVAPQHWSLDSGLLLLQSLDYWPIFNKHRYA